MKSKRLFTFIVLIFLIFLLSLCNINPVGLNIQAHSEENAIELKVCPGGVTETKLTITANPKNTEPCNIHLEPDREWILLDITDFTLAPGESKDVKVTVSAKNLPPGIYRGIITMTSNCEPKHVEFVVELQVLIPSFIVSPLNQELIVPVTGASTAEFNISNGMCENRIPVMITSYEVSGLEIICDKEIILEPYGKRLFKMIFRTKDFMPKEGYLELKIQFGMLAPQIYIAYIKLIPFDEKELMRIPEFYEKPEYFLGKNVKTYGYLIRGENPLIITDYSNFLSNKKLPENTYLYLRDLKKIFPFNYGKTYYPEYVEIIGIIKSDPIYKYTITVTQGKPYYTISIPIASYPKYEYLKPKDVKPCCNFSMIISGGINEDNNFPHYLRNIILKFEAMKNMGLATENIFIFYFDGKIPYYDSDSPEIIQTKKEIEKIAKEAKKEEIKKCFEKIKEEIKKCRIKGLSPTFTLFVTDHGGQASDKNGDEKDGKDGIIHLLGDETLSDDELKEEILKVSPLAKVNIELHQCFGGEFIEELKECGNVKVVTASKDTETSFSGEEDFETILVYRFLYNHHILTSFNPQLHLKITGSLFNISM